MQARNVADATELAALSVEIGVETFIGAGSHAEYGPYPRAICEDDPPHPTTLYGMAKLAAGQMAAQVCSDRVRFAWLRMFSTYGPKDAGGWLIPSTIATLRSGQPMALTECEQHWGFLPCARCRGRVPYRAPGPVGAGLLQRRQSGCAAACVKRL